MANPLPAFVAFENVASPDITQDSVAWFASCPKPITANPPPPPPPAGYFIRTQDNGLVETQGSGDVLTQTQ